MQPQCNVVITMAVGRTFLEYLIVRLAPEAAGYGDHEFSFLESHFSLGPKAD